MICEKNVCKTTFSPPLLGCSPESGFFLSITSKNRQNKPYIIAAQSCIIKTQIAARKDEAKLNEQSENMKESIKRMLDGIDDEKELKRVLNFVTYLYNKK